MIIWIIWSVKQMTHPISSGYVASKHRWPGLHAQKRWSRICCIHHCKVTPVPLDVGDDSHTNASLETRNYSFCIWNSGISRSAGFAFDSFDGALATSAMATDFEQDGSLASWTRAMVSFILARLWDDVSASKINEKNNNSNVKSNRPKQILLKLAS